MTKPKSKALEEEASLADMVTARTVRSPRSGKNMAAVLALRDEIEATIARGFSIKAIYNTLVECSWSWLRKHGYEDDALKQLNMGYDTFRNLCRSLKLAKLTSAHARREQPRPAGQGRKLHPKARPDGIVPPSAVTEDDLY